ncbi:hypothetical protein, partial [Mycoplasmopsis arginini]|uniref:terminase small subunit-like protein n=2 Tax=Mycoplasmopsis arginini TaxID=2094 RepID=UPI002FE6DDB0
PKFLELYTRAKEDSADTLSDEMLDIADEQCTTVKHGEGDSEREVEIVFDSTAVARNRLRVETRKWIASKLKPKKYGDKVELDAKVEHSGELLHTVGFETSAQELLNKIR